MGWRGRGSRTLLALGIGLYVATGCAPIEPIPSADGRLLVEAVLDRGSTTQSIAVRRMRATFGSPETGATVVVIAPDGSEMTAEARPADGTSGPALYVVDLARFGAQIESGASYALRVTTSASELVTGGTVVPAAVMPVFDDTTRAFSRSRDTLLVSWPRAPGARSYLVAITGRSSNAPPGYAETLYRAFVDTIIALPGTAQYTAEGTRVFTPGDTVTVTVSAVDDNFYTYYHVFVDPYAGAPPSRLSGAIGVFGSLVPLYRRRLAVGP